ncbi:MAG: hypothetical protein AMXMBFR56_73530 [Polyangiaceae bacterium]
MSKHDPVRKRSSRNGKTVLVIDFTFRDKAGAKRRYRKDAAAQTRTGARAEAARLMENAARHGTPEPLSEVPTFQAFVEKAYRPLYMPRLRPATRLRYEDLFRQGVMRAFGRHRLSEVDRVRLHAYAAELAERGVQPRGPCNLVRSVLHAAVDAGVLEGMPKLPSFPPSPKLPDAPSVEYVTELVASAAGWVKVAVALAAYAGMRQGEVRALRVGDVRFDTEQIFIRQAFSAEKVLTPKGRRERVVPLIPELAEVLRPAVQDKLPGAFVLTNGRGRVPHRQSVLTAIKRAQSRAGLPPRSHHSLRHFFGSGLLRNGVSVELVRQLLGHANLSTTARYLHAVSDASTNAAIAKLTGNGLATPAGSKR